MNGNAIISSTMLGYEDHGIFTYMIHLKGDGCGQGFGGYVLGGDYTNKVLEGILKTVGVEKWEDLVGTHIRVDGEDFGTIKKIGHIIEDKWFDPKEAK